MGLSASQQAAAEAAAQQASSSPTPPTSHLAVRVECPLTGQIIREMDVTEHLTLQLLELYDISPLDASAKMIHSLCPDPAVRDTCVTTICKYLQNAIDHPGDEKFRKIRQGNKVFQERVDSVLGGKDFLVATGFQETTLEDESYLVLPDGVDEAFLEAAQALISSNQRVEFPLYRDPQVLRVGDGASIALRTELPPDFYAITLEDVKLQHKLNAAKMDEMLSLRTKAMREAQADKRKRIYRFCLLRVRINADYVLQGTFRVTDTLQALYQFVSEALADETVEFELQTQHNRQRLPRDSTTMRKADLVPTASMALIAPTPVDLKDTFKAMAQRVN
ncbi:uncharacterized protein MONBRDRAFT_30706 [Monosiga brevicollis MX1]|uniref:UBX domain-containing protein n=1 Tax=Monosiga brevicollis TaxID=81824 RepID=A9UNP7_MONBE|nr:uncharacterized protein MONBRDRAFT_30706 [Monosiga brevicollis MX1]EDQ92737.1 predicted protein [Monosiga brevicollis MX1]|eukprot:XP_001742499.1 hypothetical protein [Monosiga brevicollis MX1]